MAVDYGKLKTPFYEVRVSDSSGKRSVGLPHHILRLLEKVEIVETFEKSQFSTITLTFIEGSREPASQDPGLGTKGLYKLNNSEGRTDMNVAGSITNRTGAVTDLRFSGSSGITFLTEAELRKGRIDTRVQENIIGKQVTRSHPGEPSAPKFLFQERNQIIIKWGYKEDPNNVRTIRGYIAIVKVDFPDNSAVVTTVTAYSGKAFLDQVAPRCGVVFGTQEKTSGNNFVITPKDRTTESLIQKICADAGIKCIVSNDLPNTTQDRHHQKIWVAGESFKQFMDRLADDTDSYWEVWPDPRTGDDVLVFLKHNDLYSKPIRNGRQLFEYKNPQSVLKSVNVVANFNIVGGQGQLGTSDDGERITNSTEFAEELQLFANKEGTNTREKAVDYRPNKVNPIKSAKGIADTLCQGAPVGKTEINPSKEEQGNFADASQVFGKAQSRGALTLEFSAYGYPKITPGSATFKNIGVRFSGDYDIITVTHTLEPNGYNIRGTAKSPAVATGGVPIPEAKIKQDGETKKAEFGLFEPVDQWRKTSETN